MTYGTAMKDPGGYLHEEDIPKIIAAAGSERNQLLIKTLAATGRRISEVVGEYGIRPSDIDPVNSRIIFTILKKRGKDKPRKWKLVPKYLAEQLAAFSANTPTAEPIFNMKRQYAFKIVRKAAEKAGVTTYSGKKVHPHHFRHTWVSKRIAEGVSFEEALRIRDYMEHSSISITQGYSHLNTKKDSVLFKDEEL